VETPSSDSDAYPFSAIDTWELSVARIGDLEPIALVSGETGESLSLDNIAYGSDLVIHLSGRSAGSELAYGRTCSFDLQRGDRAEPRLFFSRIVRWADGPALAAERSGAMHGISLRDSRFGLLWSGHTGGAIDIVDGLLRSSDGEATSLEGELVNRQGATATRFGDRVLIVGGISSSSGDAARVVEQIVPTESTVNNQVLQVDGPALTEHQSIELVDGSVLVTGGFSQSSGGEPFVIANAATKFTLLGGEIVQREIRPGLAFPRTRHEMTRLGNEVGADVLITGGRDAAGLGVAQAELYRPLSDTFESIPSAQLSFPRMDHRAVRLPGGLVLVIGGFAIASDGGLSPVRELELYDPVQGQFRSAGILPSRSGVTGMSVTELPDGRILLAGGEDIDGEPVNTALIVRFDPIDGVVDLSPTASLAVARSHHAAISLCDGTVLLAGGTASATTRTERYNPPSVNRR
tara:strand:+ start:41649 stop:43037 length:1389 start_codon:yes stop_codon:yes gene_type:complete